MSNSLLEAPENVGPVDKVEVVTQNFILGATHRCDRCQAQAYFQVTLLVGMQLLFCAHHYMENKVALEPQSLHIRDESAQLHVKPSYDDKD